MKHKYDWGRGCGAPCYHVCWLVAVRWNNGCTAESSQITAVRCCTVQLATRAHTGDFWPGGFVLKACLSVWAYSAGSVCSSRCVRVCGSWANSVEGLVQDTRRQRVVPFSGPFSPSLPLSCPFYCSCYSFRLFPPLRLDRFADTLSCSCDCQDLIKLNWLTVIQHPYSQATFPSFLPSFLNSTLHCSAYSSLHPCPDKIHLGIWYNFIIIYVFLFNWNSSLKRT